MEELNIRLDKLDSIYAHFEAHKETITTYD